MSWSGDGLPGDPGFSPDADRAALLDPATDAAALASIAQRRPELGAFVATHPNAYDGLLDWLAQHGDVKARAAVAGRRAATADRPRGRGPSPVAAGFITGGAVLLVALVAIGIWVIGPRVATGGASAATASPSASAQASAAGDRAEDSSTHGSESAPSTASTSRPTATAPAPSSLQGRWHGTISGDTRVYTVDVDILDAGGQLSAVVTYPVQPCTGHWTQTGRTTTAVTVVENMPKGNVCIDGVTLTLTPNKDGTISYSGRSGSAFLTSTLTRVG